LDTPKRTTPRPRWFGLVTWVAVGVVAAGGGLWLAKKQAESGSEQVAAPATGLPHTPDYHALLVSPVDARRLLLGTHAGLYESRDGGRRWRKGPLGGKDAMNLVRMQGGIIWAAGHNVLFESTDGGRTWREPSPHGLPGLDLHGFAADPRERDTLYAAVAGKALYRSRDGGRTFSLVTKEVGANVYGLAVLRDGRILAADPQRGVLASSDGGRRWRVVLRPSVIGLAVNPGRPDTILATGSGIFLSRDGGRQWRRVLVPPQGAGPVAWAPSDPDVAYVVGFDRTLYRTDDRGSTWRRVG
jgi:photosystem II stability/assembly factor-like uncharacterized protein